MIISKLKETKFKEGENYDFLSGNRRGSKRSKYAVDGIPFTETCPAIFYGFLKYQNILDGISKGSIARDTSGRFLVEYVNGIFVECAVYNPSNGKINASKYNTGTNEMEKYDVTKEDGSLLILAIIQAVLCDDEAKGCYEFIQMGLSGADFISDKSEFVNQLAQLSDNVLHRLKLTAEEFTIKSDFNNAKVTKIVGIPMESIKSGAYEIETQIYGLAKIFRGEKVSVKNMKSAEFNGYYRYSENAFDEPVAIIDDSYLIPDVIIEICEQVKASTSMEPAIRNILLYGDSGSGKTEGAHAMAAAFGLPYKQYVCHPQTDNFDLVGQFVPASGAGQNISMQEWLKSKKLPTMEDVTVNHTRAYQMIMGEECKNAKKEEVIMLLFEKMFDIINMESSKKDKDFVFVHSEIIEALKKGYLVEIQEPTVIVNEGVLVGLNAILAGGYITLSNGERIFKHPDSVVVFTTNTPDYAGYGNLSNSVLSRCALVYMMNTPSVDEMVERAKAKTKMPDEAILRRMAECINEILEKVKDRGLKDGACGFRELINWITSYKILGDWMKSAIPTVINKATFDESVRGEIKDIIQAKML